MALRTTWGRASSLATLAALLPPLLGCDVGLEPKEEASELVVAIPHELAWEAHGITAVHLLLHGVVEGPGGGDPEPGAPLAIHSLHLNGGTWTSTFGVPIGSYFLRAQALQGAEVLATTGFHLVEVLPGQIPRVQLALSIGGIQGEPFDNHAPVFTAIQVSTTRASPGADVTITVEAEDPDGDALFFSPALCEAPCGSLDESEVALPPGQPHVLVWTAPSADGLYAVTLRLRDDRGAATEVVLELPVGALGALQSTLTIATAPIVVRATAQVSQGALPGVEAIALEATVAGGVPPFSYTWSAEGASCPGSFTSPTDPAPVFHPVEGTPSLACIFAVTIADAGAAEATARVGYQRSAAPRYAPALGKDFQSADILGPGEPIELRVVADVANPNPTFVWTAPGPGLREPTIVSSDTESTFTWQVRPRSVHCDVAGATTTIEVVVIDTVWNLASPSVRFTLELDPKLCLR